MAKKKKSPETKGYLPPVSPVAIQPGDTGFKMVGRAYNRWMGLFGDWQKKKGGIANPDTTWDMNKKPMTTAQMKKKGKTLHLKESMGDITRMEWEEMQEEKISGGLADGLKISDIAKKHGVPTNEISWALEDGIKVEMEHTDDKEIAKEIAKDHLFEDPKYYEKLATIEEDLIKGPIKGSDKVWVKPGSAKIYPYLDVDAKQDKKGKKNLENLKDYRDWLGEGKKYKPEEEYKEDSRREMNLSQVRRTKEYEQLIELGFKEDSSHQQELNNTMKFIRTRNKQKETGHDDVFYTIHPTGVVRRYNPEKGKEVPEGSGNVIKKFPAKFSTPKDYKKGLRYLWQYLRRKENRGDYR